MFQKYDLIVVGGGHSGCEAAAAAAQMGSRVLLVTMNMTTIAHMSCNPAMGGIAKGQILREIDALGGIGGKIADKSAIQFRMLNRSKGPAMWSPRTQNDRMLFAKEWRLALEKIYNLDFWQEMVTGIITDNGEVKGVETGLGHKIYADAVVLTNGTFLNGIIHIGEKQRGGGRSGEKASKGITEQLLDLGFRSGRMKTGTPPRVDGRSLDYSKMEEQKGDEIPQKFSFDDDTTPLNEQRSCYISYTNNEVHEILKTGFEKSPMFNGSIQAVGPRYCPSIEDKINRFADKPRHQIFVEPEGWETIEVYVNGFSTSLPEDIQYKALTKIPGFENAKMFRPGYAIEYDFFPPDQLELSLETKKVKNLFFAGQINGTTGYEEAGCQGLIAGINAHLKLNEKDPLILKRNQAYIGVLIDDLVNKGTDEPYRMFTSRAEYRLLMRQDNADLRLTELSYKLGLASEKRYKRVKQKEENIDDLLNYFNKTKAEPSEELNNKLEELGCAPLKGKQEIYQLIKRPYINPQNLSEALPELKEKLKDYPREDIDQATINIKYKTYIEKEKQLADKMNQMEDLKITNNIDYDRLSSLSAEGREKLKKVNPETIGQASRISGVTQSDVSVLMVYMGK